MLTLDTKPAYRLGAMEDDFLLLCREIYRQGIRPGTATKHAENASYQRLVKVARHWFDAGKEEEFYQIAQEGHYFVQLWVAHLLLDYGAPSVALTAQALAIIRRYAAPDYTVDEVVAEHEAHWLLVYKQYALLKREKPRQLQLTGLSTLG